MQEETVIETQETESTTTRKRIQFDNDAFEYMKKLSKLTGLSFDNIIHAALGALKDNQALYLSSAIQERIQKQLDALNSME